MQREGDGAEPEVKSISKAHLSKNRSMARDPVCGRRLPPAEKGDMLIIQDLSNGTQAYYYYEVRLLSYRC